MFDRAADPFDWIAMTLVGGRLQRANWEEIVSTVVAESGGAAPAGVEHAAESLEGEAAEHVERWLGELALERKRAANAVALGVDDAGLPPADRGPPSAG